MYIGELKNKEMQTYRKRGKIKALRAAKKAAYLTESLGKQLRDDKRIVQPRETINDNTHSVQSNMISSQAQSFGSFRTIKLRYSMIARFGIK